MKVSFISMIVNIALSVLKLIAGILAHSSAMVSDAVHSASDVFSTIVVIVGVKIAGKKADSDHPYGHERMECVASILLANILALTGAGIGWVGIEKILAGNHEFLQTPGILALVMAVVSIIVKEWMYWYTRAAAKKLNLGVLMADAWHHRTDALSSVGAFIGILGARMGFPVLDPVASVVIALCILKAAFDIFKDGLDKLVDHSCSEEIELKIRETVEEHAAVKKIDDLKTRMFGAKIYVDVEILLDGSLNLNAAHEIAEEVHDAIEEAFPECKHCMVHVNPTSKRA